MNFLSLTPDKYKLREMVIQGIPEGVDVNTFFACLKLPSNVSVTIHSEEKCHDDSSIYEIYFTVDSETSNILMQKDEMMVLNRRIRVGYANDQKKHVQTVDEIKEEYSRTVFIPHNLLTTSFLMDLAKYGVITRVSQTNQKGFTVTYSTVAAAQKAVMSNQSNYRIYVYCSDTDIKTANIDIPGYGKQRSDVGGTIKIEKGLRPCHLFYNPKKLERAGSAKSGVYKRVPKRKRRNKHYQSQPLSFRNICPQYALFCSIFEPRITEVMTTIDDVTKERLLFSLYQRMQPINQVESQYYVPYIRFYQ